MTTSALSAPPLHSSAHDDNVPNGEDQAQRAAELAALHRAADAGEEAAAWVRQLAGRQGEEEHGRLLERVAEAIVKASSREIIPGSDGLLTEELRYTLAADVVLGASHTTGTLPELHPGERMPLIAVCSIAATLPSCVLGDLVREVEVLAAEMEAATDAGRAAELPAAG
ncbi:hypothetical protein ABT095_35105 [Kitasatospora sp. NPDC002227]|uniref:hypothetical protein n=1 Tax=Kitasatospora sp. NPDC002227 TaxID=3154773 RepID=UPI00332E6FE9